MPRPRQPVQPREWVVPLALGLGLAGVAVAVELAQWVRFVYPLRLLVLVPVVPWLWWLSRAHGGGLPRSRRAAALLLRTALVALAAAALAEPRAMRTSDARAVIFVLDRSDSIPPGWSDRALQWIQDANRHRDASKVDIGLVVFGRDAGVEQPPRRTFAFEGAINTQISRDATNLEQGLSLAAALLPEGTAGRVVLLSDGVATEGQVERAVEQLARRAIPVDVLAVPYEHRREVWLERIDLPRQVKVGEPYEANVVVGALGPGQGEIVLRENDREIGRVPVRYEAGKTRVRVKLELRQPGYYEYLAQLRVPEGEDGRPENNLAVGELYLRGEGRVLVLYDAGGEALDRQHLVAALRAARRVVDERPGYDAPRTAMALLSYDLVVLVNVPADQLDVVQMSALRGAVYDMGVGAIMVGGRNAFGPGGWHKTPVEELLPVEMDIQNKKRLPKSALAIVLHTCEFPDGNTWGKNITKQAIRVLGERDDVGVLVYGSSATQSGDCWLFPFTAAGEFPRLAPLINQAEIGDMPAFGPTFEMAVVGFDANDAAAKHLIVISDGDPQPPPGPLLQKFIDRKISISTVSIFPHGGTEVAIMRKIAELTGGRYYNPTDPNALPSIFIREAKTLKRNMFEPGTFVPQRADPSAVLKGIDSVPPLHALVLTTVKPRATLALVKVGAEDTDPVLATWRYGLGQSAAFTSDLSVNWGRDWVSWDGYAAFVRQLAQDVSRAETPSYLQLTTVASGSRAVIEVEDHHPDDALLTLRARVNGPRGEERELVLEPVAPRRYRAELPLWGTGRYQVLVGGAGGGRAEQAFSGFAVPYSPEYLRFRSDPATLARVAQATGGRELAEDEAARAFDPPASPARSSRPLEHEIIQLLAWLLVLDVALRRVQLDASVIRRLWHGREAAAGTLTTLLATKQRVQVRRPEPIARPVAPLRPVVASPPPVAPAPPATPAASAAPAAPPSTTGHLLALKRKRQQGRQPEDENRP